MSAAFTPGPWGWFGHNHGIYLATTHSGRRYVMGFKRMGAQGAQPTFQVAGHIVPAAELVQFEVGDGTARGFAAGKADPSVYRYDVSAVDCPDAYLIAAAPELYSALAELVETLRREAPGTPLNNHRFDALGIAANNALAKARGEAL